MPAKTSETGLLRRLIKRHLGVDGADPAAAVTQLKGRDERTLLAGLERLLMAVDESFLHADRELALARRSLEVVSDELVSKNTRLRDEAAIRETILLSLRNTVVALGLRNPTATADDSANPLYSLASAIPRLVEEHVALNQELEQRVVQRTEALQRANAELAEALDKLKKTQAQLLQTEKLASLGAIVSAVAHELNTPIGNCVTIASTLYETTEEVAAEAKRGAIKRSTFNDYLASAHTASHLLLKGLARAHSLVQDFRQVAVDQNTERRRYFELNQFIRENAAVLQGTLRVFPIQLKLELGAAIEVDSFPGALSKVIGNAVDNAVLHAFAGRAEGTIRLITERSSCGVVIKITDDDIGMANAVVKRVLDPFFTTKLGQGGSGLGMYISYNLVTGLLGGTIAVRSTPGQGTEVELAIPLVAPSMCAACQMSGAAGEVARQACREPDCPLREVGNPGPG